MVMPQALAQVTFPVSLHWSLTQLEEPHWLLYVCQLLEMCLTRLMRFEQSKVRAPNTISVFAISCSCTVVQGTIAANPLLQPR